MQVGLVARKRALEAEESGIRHRVDGPLVARVRRASCRSRSPATSSSAIAEITHDMAGAAPMHRLLQGDVGSGKTVVALAALLVAVQGGYQGAFMAPTEVLAEQHYLGSVRLLEGLDGRRRGLAARRPAGRASRCSRTAPPRPSAAGSRRARKRARSTSSSARTRCSTATREFSQARPRGDRRAAPLRRRAARAAAGRRATEPDVLVMTATPIPRTAAMLVYGDLDKSELREMPPGRTPIDTTLVGPSPLDQARRGTPCATRSTAGHQAYVVCPLVEDKGKVEAKAATAEYERLQAEELAGLRLGLLHGQMPSKEKEAVMARVPRRRARRARRHHRDRGRRRRAQRDRHGRRGRRPLRALAAPPAARPGRARRRPVVLLLVRRPDHRGRRGAAGGDGRVDRRVPARGEGPRDPRRGRGVRRAASRGSTT